MGFWKIPSNSDFLMYPGHDLSARETTIPEGTMTWVEKRQDEKKIRAGGTTDQVRNQ